MLDGRARFWSCRTESLALQNSDAHAAQMTLSVCAHGNRSGERIACVRASHYFEEQTHVRDGAGHGADNADPGKSASARRKCPVAGMRPGVGFNPQIPQKCAGTRMEPPPSLPTPPDEQPAAIAAASPPLEPPAEYARFHGLLVFPWVRLLVS